MDRLSKHADGAGWYDCEVRRTAEGWCFAKVTPTVRYVSGGPITH